MPSGIDSRQVFSGTEFQLWAYAGSNLRAPEQYLVHRYLDPSGKTLEAGTGGGRIVRALSNLGFFDLAGFDNVPGLIKAARLQDPEARIAFRVADARDLPYLTEEFDQVLYLQQIICFIGEEEGRQQAVLEAHRVLKPGGIALFSFLCYEVRLQSSWHRAMIRYIGALRSMTRRRESLQSLPLMVRRGKPNFAAFLDQPYYVYWFRIQEAAELLTSCGFTIVGIATKKQIDGGNLCESAGELKGAPLNGMLYVVCRKDSF